MSWAKLDDGFFDHPKVLVAGEDAANLYVRGLVWCCKHLTDGAIPREALRTLTGRRDAAALAAKLVASGLWEMRDGGWAVHDFHDHNPTAAEVKARRSELSAKRAEAGKRGGIRSGQVRGMEANAKQTASKPEASCSGVAEAKRSPIPSHPILSHPKEEKTPPPPVVASARRVADETPAPRAVEAPSAPSPTRPATDRYDLPAVAVEEALIAATGGRLRLSAAAAPMGAAIVERLRREGVTIDELPRIAAVIGADGGRLLWPWPPDLRVTIDHLAKPALPDGGGWGCTALGEAVAAARDGGVEGLRRRAATSARPARAGDRLAHLRAPMATPADFARDAAAIEATKIQDPAERRAALAAIGVAEHDAPF